MDSMVLDISNRLVGDQTLKISKSGLCHLDFFSSELRSIYFESLPYRVHPETGLIDFDELRKTVGWLWVGINH